MSEVVTLRKEQWESVLEINDQLLGKCEELQQKVRELSIRNGDLQRKMIELRKQAYERGSDVGLSRD